ncbi:hypothetical protein VW23_004480 [Devosia insulae DS-56]|uniref:Nucleotidyltransferase family protein n=1 Tax=Devosia insulae DS-56 TaxID=1116389 RepID=A0A1E5XIV1_9HYPH|nr:nucleotidyltransferase family protein [Devosia insulae]OEO28519.1 hypothetical protein VW23_004480 [Devosia insulae DS-56]
MTAPGPTAELHALLVACLRFDAAGNDGVLADRIAAAGWEQLLAHADELRLGSVLVRAAARRQLAPAVPPLTLPDGRMTITKALQQRDADHLARRGIMRRRLDEIVSALRQEAIVPLALKGGRSIVTGAPDWRHLRDLDLLVAPRQAQRAQEIVLALGYRPAGEPRPRLIHHHLHELYRADMPGWIEIHRRGGPSRVEQFLPSAELLASAVDAAPARVGAMILPDHLHVLHGIIHHHVGHRAVKHATIEIKALYELAAAVTDMDEAERRRLLERAARHPRLLAILELWTAAAADLLGMPVLAPLRAPKDAAAWWAGMAQAEPGTPSAGIGPELRAATAPERLRRAIGGGSALRRLYWRLTMPLTFVKRPMLMPTLPRRPAPPP